MNNRRGIAWLIPLLSIVVVLIFFYIALYIPIPAFTKIRVTINYFLLLIFWIVLQVGIVYAYTKLVQLVIKNFLKVKSTIAKYTLYIKTYVHRHS